MDSVLSSRKPIPEMKSHSPLKQLVVVVAVFFFFLFFYNRCPVTLHYYTSLILCLGLHYNVVRATVKANANKQVFCIPSIYL